jgi:DNA-binding transcriptional LysR family regulator
MIDLVALRSLLAVDSHGTVAAAATATGYTPSAVSQQIKRLERELGVDLLDRVGRGVVLTQQGRLLVQHGQGILRHLEAAMSGLQADDGSLRGALRIVSFATAFRGLLTPLAAELATTGADLSLELVERDPPEAVELVAAGQADLAVVHNWIGVPLRRPGHLMGAELGQDVADLIVHRDHPLAARAQVTPADLVDQPWVSPPVGSICHAWLSYMFAAQRPEIRFWSGEFATHLDLVAARVAVALIPRLGRGTLPAELVAVPVIDPVPTRVIEVLWRESMAGSPAVKHLTSRLAALFAERSATLALSAT